MNPPNAAVSAPTDFDFLVGSWSVEHRKLKQRLAGSTDWIEFPGTMTLRHTLGGFSNVDISTLQDPTGAYRALTLRTYSPADRTWSIYWVDGRGPRLDPPVHGRFEGSVGTFQGDDVFNGKPIQVRFVWTKLDDDHLRWEQAFSPDGGSTWETNWTMAFTRIVDTRQWCGGPSASGCQVLELRQYTTHPGKREQLIDLFEQQFVETQEAAGMAVLGQFRDLDDPDRFVWLRGFADMSERVNGLTTFYTGPTWRTHREQANATMADSDNVLLLRPAWRGSGLTHSIGDRPDPHAGEAPAGFVDITVFPLNAPPAEDLIAFSQATMQPALERGGAMSVAWYVTEASPNNFPRLPVRQSGPVLVGIALFSSKARYEAFASNGSWQRDVAPGLTRWLDGEPQILHLEPTARSAYRAGANN